MSERLARSHPLLLPPPSLEEVQVALLRFPPRLFRLVVVVWPRGAVSVEDMDGWRVKVGGGGCECWWWVGCGSLLGGVVMGGLACVVGWGM